MNEVLVVRRVIPVSREEVFEAWLDAEGMAQWMRPANTSRTTVELDPRVGGNFRIVMSHNEQVEHWGEYLAIEPPKRLSFTWFSAYTDLQPTIVTIEFAEHAGGTELTLTHRNLPMARIEAHRQGWTEILQCLSIRTHAE